MKQGQKGFAMPASRVRALRMGCGEPLAHCRLLCGPSRPAVNRRMHTATERNR